MSKAIKNIIFSATAAQKLSNQSEDKLQAVESFLDSTKTSVENIFSNDKVIKIDNLLWGFNVDDNLQIVFSIFNDMLLVTDALTKDSLFSAKNFLISEGVNFILKDFFNIQKSERDVSSIGD